MTWLESAVQKLARADEHLSTLETQMRKELDSKEYTVTRETETKIIDDLLPARVDSSGRGFL